MIDETISHYRIVEKVGGGGMGVGLQGRRLETRPLRRPQVPAHDVAKDPQALTRFQRQARAASALNHPNICTIHEIDEQDGQAFIVAVLTVTAASSMYQCADTESIAFGFGRVAPIDAHPCV
jgi:serine/threonine protein kinase